MQVARWFPGFLQDHDRFPAPGAISCSRFKSGCNRRDRIGIFRLSPGEGPARFARWFPGSRELHCRFSGFKATLSLGFRF